MLWGTFGDPHSSHRTSLSFAFPLSCLNGRGNPKGQLTRDRDMKEEEEGNIDGGLSPQKAGANFFYPGGKYDRHRVVLVGA